MARLSLLALLAATLSCSGRCPGQYADPTLLTDRWADCDGVPTNACEVNLATDRRNCGNCGHVCGDEHTTEATCVHARCTISCQPTFANCNGVDDDGCEIDLSTDPLNCGECGNICPDDACAGGVCQHPCPTGWTLCDRNISQRYCADLKNDKYNCGSCGYRCPFNRPTCVNGSC